MNKINKKVILLTILLIVMCLFFTKIGLNESNDTFYLLKLGELISKQGIDFKDHFSWISDLTYTYPHWLYSIVIYGVYKLFSSYGIFCFNFISYGFLILSIYFVNRKMHHNDFVAFLVALISIFLVKYSIVPRPYVISTIIFFLEVFFIHQLINYGSKKYLFYLFILSVLLANIHGTGWIMYFILFMPFFGEIIVNKIKKKKWSFDDRIEINKINNSRLLFWAFVIAFLGGLLSPSRICYTYVFKIMKGISESYIVEHQPIAIIYCPFVFLSLFFLFFSKVRIRLYELLMISGITFMSFKAYRHILFFYTIVFLYLAVILVRNIKFDKKNEYTIEFLERLLLKKSFIFIGIMVFAILTAFNINKNLHEPLDESYYPIGAAEFLKKEIKEDSRLFNDYNYGSYLLFNDIKVFVDSRCDLYLPEFNNTTALKDYFETEYDYDELLNKYQIEYVLLKKDSFQYHLLKFILEDKLYEDDNFIVYKRGI